MQLQEVWGGDRGVMHVFISGRQNQQGLEPRGGLQPWPIWRSHGEIVPFHQIRNPKCNRSQIHSKHVISLFSPPFVPRGALFPVLTGRRSIQMCVDYQPHFCWILDHNFPFFSLQPLQKQSCIFRLKDRGPHLFIEITIRSRRGDLRCQITSIYLQYKTA